MGRYLNYARVERLIFGRGKIPNSIPVKVYDYGAYSVIPYPYDEELIAWYESQVEDKESFIKRYIFYLTKEEIENMRV